MKFLNYIKQIFDSGSTVSSKRIAGITIVFWSLCMGTYFILHGVDKITSNDTISNLIEFALATGAAVLTGGTVAESFRRRD